MNTFVPKHEINRTWNHFHFPPKGKENYLFVIVIFFQNVKVKNHMPNSKVVSQAHGLI